MRIREGTAGQRARGPRPPSAQGQEPVLALGTDVLPPAVRPDEHGSARALEAAARLFDDGTLTSTLTRTLSPLSTDTLREAHRLVESSAMIGKVVVSATSDEAFISPDST